MSGMMAGMDAGSTGPKIWLWPEQAVYVGPALPLDPHATAVDCYALGIDAPFVLTIGRSRLRLRSTLIPARTRHHIDAGTSRMVFFYNLAPAHSPARPQLRALLTHLTGPPDPSILRDLIVGAVPAGPPDPRVRSVIRTLFADPAAPHSAADAAAAVGLSPSRFLHLFTEHTGTSFRRYRMWARLVRFGECVAVGSDFTRAAADAGFASPSHFSDTFRAVFGITASTLLAHGVDIAAASGPA